MNSSTVFTRDFDVPPHRVWRALTVPDLLANWLMQNDLRLEIGAEFTFRTKPAPGFDGIIRCQVVEIVENQKLVYSWKGGGIDTVVDWTLAPTSQGTRLTLCHSGFKGFKAAIIRRMLKSGWHSMLSGEAFSRQLQELE